jgi:hypothetical protein
MSTIHSFELKNKPLVNPSIIYHFSIMYDTVSVSNHITCYTKLEHLHCWKTASGNDRVKFVLEKTRSLSGVGHSPLKIRELPRNSSPECDLTGNFEDHLSQKGTKNRNLPNRGVSSSHFPVHPSLPLPKFLENVFSHRDQSQNSSFCPTSILSTTWNLRQLQKLQMENLCLLLWKP